MKKIIFALLTVFGTLSAAPQAIVFDFGGVLTGPLDRESVVNFIKTSLHFTQEEFEQANTEKRKALKQGMTDAEFWLKYAQSHNIMLPNTWEKEFDATVKSSLGINLNMYLLIENLKERGYQVAMLSNIDERLANFIKSFGFYEPFSPCLLSYKLGCAKPDPQIYNILLTELKLPAQDVIFIDDMPENVDAARKVGIDAILFTSQVDLEKELEKRQVIKP